MLSAKLGSGRAFGGFWGTAECIPSKGGWKLIGLGVISEAFSGICNGKWLFQKRIARRGRRADQERDEKPHSGHEPLLEIGETDGFEQAKAKLSSNHYDLMFLDYHLRGQTTWYGLAQLDPRGGA